MAVAGIFIFFFVYKSLTSFETAFFKNDGQIKKEKIAVIVRRRKLQFFLKIIIKIQHTISEKKKEKERERERISEK